MKAFRFAFLLSLLAVGASAQTRVDGKDPQLPPDLGPFGGLKVECLGGTCAGGGGGGGSSQTDNTTFLLGTNAFTAGGGTYNTTLSALSTGVAAAFRITQHRALWINLRDNAGAEIGTAGNPLTFNCNTGCGSPPTTADNSAFTFGTTNVTPIGAVVDDVSTNTVSENSFGAPRMSGSRILYIDISKTTANATAIKTDSSATTQPVSGPLTDTQLRASAVPVTSNAGTNTSTAALALETGGNLAAIKARTDNIPAQGQALAAGSLPVVLTAAQVTTLTPPAAITGFSTEATLATLNGKVTAVNTGAVVLAAGSALVGEVNATATATTTNGLSRCVLQTGASTNATNCKASAGNIYGIMVSNTTTTNMFLRMYNSSGTPTCSSATGFTETIPMFGAAVNGAVNGRMNSAPEAYSTGIAFCATGGGTSTDNTNAAVGGYITILYK